MRACSLILWRTTAAAHKPFASGHGIRCAIVFRSRFPYARLSFYYYCFENERRRRWWRNERKKNWFIFPSFALDCNKYAVGVSLVLLCFFFWDCAVTVWHHHEKLKRPTKCYLFGVYFMCACVHPKGTFFAVYHLLCRSFASSFLLSISIGNCFLCTCMNPSLLPFRFAIRKFTHKEFYSSIRWKIVIAIRSNK